MLSQGLPQIGSLDQVDDFTWEVAHRPLSMSSNELVRLGSLPQAQLPSTTFNTASSYFEYLAKLRISHLVHQRNDAIESANDCRRKFVARKLFLKLTQGEKLHSPQFENGPFKLWCDNLRPAKVLLDKSLNIVGVVNWEFSYAAPVEFSHAPPWWLLIEKPEYWEKGLEDWCLEFERRLQTFLRAIMRRENKEIEQGKLEECQRLSSPMRDSWKSGDFWIAYAARNNFAFDLIYWEKIDRRFFGDIDCSIEDTWNHRLGLLNDGEKDEMENLVAQKLREMETRVLAWDPDDYTLAALKLQEDMVTKEDPGLTDYLDRTNSNESLI